MKSGSVSGGYMIRGGQAGKDRLDVLDLAYRDGTAELLRRCGVSQGGVSQGAVSEDGVFEGGVFGGGAVGLGEGVRCIEVGAGGGHATRQLARAVGPRGRVVGVDIDPAILELARRDAKSEGLDNVEFQAADAERLPFEDGFFDVAYARLVLTHLAEPLAALREMARMVRPGGLVIVEDLDWDGVFCHPSAPGFERYRQVHAELHRRRGGDPEVGPKLPGMFRRAGLTDVDLTLAHPAHVVGRAKTLHALTLVNIADALVGEGLMTEDEIEVLQRELEALAADPETVVAQPRIFQVWGRRAGQSSPEYRRSIS